MHRTWNTTRVPLNERLIVWIKSKIEGTKRGIIVIEIQDSRVITIHYRTSEYILDFDHCED